MFHHSRTMGFDTQFCAAFWAEGGAYLYPTTSRFCCCGVSRGGGSDHISLPAVEWAEEFREIPPHLNFLAGGAPGSFRRNSTCWKYFDRRKFVARNSGLNRKNMPKRGGKSACQSLFWGGLLLSVVLLGLAHRMFAAHLDRIMQMGKKRKG